jgi:hypothetical protein
MRIKLEKKNKTQQTWIEGWNWKQSKPWQKKQEKNNKLKEEGPNWKRIYLKT